MKSKKSNEIQQRVGEMFQQVRKGVGQAVDKTKQRLSPAVKRARHKLGEFVRQVKTLMGGKSTFTTHADDNRAKNLLGRSDTSIDANFVKKRVEKHNPGIRRTSSALSAARNSTPSQSTENTDAL